MKKLFTAALAIALALSFGVAKAQENPYGTRVIEKQITLGSNGGAITLKKLSNLEANSTGWFEVPYGVPFTLSVDCDSAAGDSAMSDADSFQVRVYIKCNNDKILSDSGVAEGYEEWTRFSNDFQLYHLADTSTKALFIPNALVDVAYNFKFVNNLTSYIDVLDTATAVTGALQRSNLREYTRMREVPYCNSILVKVWPLADSVWAIGCKAKVNVNVRYNGDQAVAGR